MDALKQQLLKVQQQLAGLSASQKMLTGSLLVIMVMTLFYWSRFAGQSDMEAVMDKTLAGEELANVRAAIAEQGIESEVRDGKVYVAASKRPLVTQALSKLAINGKLPAGMADAAPAEESKFSILSNASERTERRLDKAGRVAEGIIRSWQGVTAARVVFNGEKRGSTLGAELPTASVSISFEGNAGEQKRIADSTRMNVSHMLSGLKPEGVGITINGKPFKYSTDGDSDGTDGSVLAARKEWEKYFAGEVINRLEHIKKLQVTVRVNMQTSSSEIAERKVDPKNKVVAPKKETSSSDVNTQTATGGEAGTVPNVGLTDATTTPGTSSSTEKTDTENVVDIGYKNVWTKTPGGNNTPQTASIGVPVSYYRTVWRRYTGNMTGEPTMSDLKPIIAEQSASIRESVKSALVIADDKSVTVDTYFDEDPIKAPEIVTAGLGALPAATNFGAKEIAIGVLAVVSLLMVSMMVKKSATQPQLAVATSSAVGPIAEDTGASHLSIREYADEAHEADLALAGQELSEEAIEARQVIEQVGTMVKQNPETAAALVKRWMNQH